MKKVLFLMFLLLLMGLGTANLKAQVRIGGDGAPNAAAVLDLNATDGTTGTKGLALPRVSLTDANTPLQGSPTIAGMLVYNTNAALGLGVYFWNGSEWLILVPTAPGTLYPTATMVKVLDTVIPTPAIAANASATVNSTRVLANDFCTGQYTDQTLEGRWLILSKNGSFLIVVPGSTAMAVGHMRVLCLRAIM